MVTSNIHKFPLWHALLLIALTFAHGVDGQMPLPNDPSTAVSPHDQVITAVVVIVVVVASVTILSIFYWRHVYRHRRILQGRRNNLRLCEVSPWQVDSSSTLTHDAAPGAPQPPPPAYATVPRPPPYAGSPAAGSNLSDEQKAAV